MQITPHPELLGKQVRVICSSCGCNLKVPINKVELEDVDAPLGVDNIDLYTYRSDTGIG